MSGGVIVSEKRAGTGIEGNDGVAKDRIQIGYGYCKSATPIAPRAETIGLEHEK
jgi:hypothetical protein